MIWNSDNLNLRRSISLSNFQFWFTHREVFSWKRIRAQQKDEIATRMLADPVSWGLLNQSWPIWSPREPQNTQVRTSSQPVNPVSTLLTLPEKPVQLCCVGIFQMNTACMLRSRRLCRSCQVSWSFYLVFQIFQKELSVATVSSRTVLFLNY